MTPQNSKRQDCKGPPEEAITACQLSTAPPISRLRAWPRLPTCTTTTGPLLPVMMLLGDWRKLMTSGTLQLAKVSLGATGRGREGWNRQRVLKGTNSSYTINEPMRHTVQQDRCSSIRLSCILEVTESKIFKVLITGNRICNYIWGQMLTRLLVLIISRYVQIIMLYNWN